MSKSKIHKFMRPLWALLCLGFLATPTTSQAAKDVRIAIMSRSPQGMSQDNAAWITRFMNWKLRKQPRIVLLKDADVQKALTSRKVPRKVHIRMRLVKRYLGKAKKLYSMRALPLARRCKYVHKALNLAERFSNEIKDYLESPTLIRELYLYRALAYMGMQQKRKTQEATLRLVKFDPDFSPTGMGFPSSFVQYHTSIVNYLRRMPPVTMNLRSVPSGAKVYHNYKYVGLTPHSLTGLIAGKHAIRLSYPGYKVWSKTANLSQHKGKTISPQVPLQRDPNALSLAGVPIFAQDAAVSDDIMDKLKAIIKRLDIKHIYVVEARRTARGDILKIATFKMGYNRIRYRNVPIGRTRGDYRTRITAFVNILARSIAPPPPVAYRPPPRPRVVVTRTPRQPYRNTYRRPARQPQAPPTVSPVRTMTPRTVTPVPTRRVVKPRVAVIPRRTPYRPPPPKTDGPTPFYGTWWFWTVVVGGVAAAAAGAVTISILNAPPPSATIIITNDANAGNTP